MEQALKKVEFHANWKLENTCKSFKSLKQSTAEHQENKELLSIEALLFESYLYMSKFKGNDETNIAKAKKKNEEALCAISVLPNTSESIKDGYKSMYWALKLWFATSPSEKKRTRKKLKTLLTAYQDGAEKDKREFEASIHATKGFALSRLFLSRYEESETELKLATEKCPENVEWKFLFGLIIWRRHKPSYKFQWSNEMNRVEKIMAEVLELDAHHAYAKTILADIYRRQYEKDVMNAASIDQNTVDHILIFENAEDPRIKKIMKLLDEAKQNADRSKTLSLIAQCYIRMGECRCKRVRGNNKCRREPKCNSIYFEKAHNVIEDAKKSYGELSCLLIQEAVLYREKNETNKELECLENAIALNPSNAGAKFQKAKVLASLGRDDEVVDVYDNLLSYFEGDPFTTFQINFNYSTYLISVKQHDDAVCKKLECLDVALQSFVKSTSGKGPVEFIDTQQSSVNGLISYLINRFKNEEKEYCKNKVVPLQKNAQLHEKIGDFKTARHYYCEALKAFHFAITPNTNHDQKIQLLFGFANMNLQMGNVDVCSNIVLIIIGETCLKEQDHVRQLTVDLFVEKGEKAAESGDSLKAIRMFTRATEMGSLNAAKRLLEETKMTKETKLRMTALKCIASIAKNNENWSKEFNLKQELAELLHFCHDGTFIGKKIKPLRGCQLEMEYSILMDDDKIATNISIVLQQGRNILNHAMEYFGKKHYPNCKAKSVDFIIIPKPEQAVDERVKKVLDSRKWKNFRNRFTDLFKYLVSIQPATDDKFEWLEVLNDLNNDDKHRDPLKKSKETISVARDACANIEDILTEIYKWAPITDNASW